MSCEGGKTLRQGMTKHEIPTHEKMLMTNDEARTHALPVDQPLRPVPHIPSLRSRGAKILSRTPSPTFDMSYRKSLWGKVRRCPWLHPSRNQHHRTDFTCQESPYDNSMTGLC